MTEVLDDPTTISKKKKKGEKEEKEGEKAWEKKCHPFFGYKVGQVVDAKVMR